MRKGNGKLLVLQIAWYMAVIFLIAAVSIGSVMSVVWSLK